MRFIEQLNKNGFDILLIGHKNHPEVIGTMGQLPQGSIKLIETNNLFIMIYFYPFFFYILL